VEDRLPSVLREGARGRIPVIPAGYEELIQASLEQRQAERFEALERATGHVGVLIPELPSGRPPLDNAPLPPAPNATGGTVRAVRGVWVAKFNPLRAIREQATPGSPSTVTYSDVFDDYPWGDLNQAQGQTWINSWLMRGGPAAIAGMRSGDLVFVTRTKWHTSDGGWLKRRTIVGVWCVDSTVTWPEVDADGRLTHPSQAQTFPLRRFDFPVPIEATSSIDLALHNVRTFHNLTQISLAELSAAEGLAVVRACGMPAAALTEPDPNQLLPLLRDLDLGPPTVVRARILAGARAAAHRFSVERAARDVAVAALRRARMAVSSTEREMGLGSDLLVGWQDADGTEGSARVEVKGLSGGKPWQARLTRSEHDAAIADNGGAGWLLLIVTWALRRDRKQRWLSSTEAAAVFTVRGTDGHYSADPVAAAALDVAFQRPGPVRPPRWSRSASTRSS
jgi:hypothetical protein